MSGRRKGKGRSLLALMLSTEQREILRRKKKQ
jgi:hypothetical protein